MVLTHDIKFIETTAIILFPMFRIGTSLVSIAAQRNGATTIAMAIWIFFLQVFMIQVVVA